MPEQFDRTQFDRHPRRAVEDKPAEFQEAPGEAEADAVRDAFLKGAGPGPAAQAAALSDADGAVRARAVSRLQQERGNAYVQRVMAELQKVPQSIQRYRVGVPANADCATVLDWMNTSNPYAGEGNWAKTRVRFRWSGGLNITGSAPDFHVSVVNPRVTVSKTVDMPQWRPRDRALRSAWRNMYRTLRAHEAEHEGIGTAWRTILLDRLRALDLPVTAPDRATAMRQANDVVNAEWSTWLDEHQEAQSAIDPYTAPLECPEEEASTSAE